MIYPNSQTSLISLNQISPIYVTFYATEKDLPRIQKYFNKDNNLVLRVAFENLEKNYIEGYLNMLDNQVDTETGLIKLRGLFTNENKMLWPGKFVKTRLILKIKKDALSIPFKQYKRQA